MVRMFSSLDSAFPRVDSLCLAASSTTSSFGFMCHYIFKMINVSEKVLFVSFRDAFESYKTAMRKTGVDWSKVEFIFNTLPSLCVLESFDAVIFDIPTSHSDFVQIFERCQKKKLLLCIDSADEAQVQFFGRRCQCLIEISPLSTGLSSEYDGLIKSGKGDEFLFKFGDKSLVLSQSIK